MSQVRKMVLIPENQSGGVYDNPTPQMLEIMGRKKISSTKNSRTNSIQNNLTNPTPQMLELMNRNTHNLDTINEEPMDTSIPKRRGRPFKNYGYTGLNSKEKGLRIAQITLKLANARAYNDKGEILRHDGSIVSNTDLSSLLNLALGNDKVHHGIDEFVSVLYRSSVNPDLLVNELIKSKLVSLYSEKSHYTHTDPIISSTYQPIVHVSRPQFEANRNVNPYINASYKRKNDEEMDEMEYNPHNKRINWDTNGN